MDKQGYKPRYASLLDNSGKLGSRAQEIAQRQIYAKEGISLPTNPGAPMAEPDTTDFGDTPHEKAWNNFFTGNSPQAVATGGYTPNNPSVAGAAFNLRDKYHEAIAAHQQQLGIEPGNFSFGAGMSGVDTGAKPQSFSANAGPSIFSQPNPATGNVSQFNKPSPYELPNTPLINSMNPATRLKYAGQLQARDASQGQDWTGMKYSGNPATFQDANIGTFQTPYGEISATDVGKQKWRNIDNGQ